MKPISAKSKAGDKGKSTKAMPPRMPKNQRRPGAKANAPVPMKKSDATRLKVLEVTSDLFRRNGYHATSMRDIAAAVGMKSGSLYYYYESKEALLSAILNENIKETLGLLHDSVQSLSDDATVRNKFEIAIDVSVKGIAEFGDMALASSQILSYLQEPEYSEQVELRQAYNRFWRDLIDEGKKTGEIRGDLPDAVVSMAIVGALSYVGEWFDGKRNSTKRIGQIFADLFFEGMSG